MPKVAFTALLVCLTAAGVLPAATDDDTTPGTDAAVTVEKARERLTDLLFSDEIDRIDFQATTYEEGVALIHTAVDRILDRGVAVLGDASIAADKATEVIEALNGSKTKGMYMTFQKEKQALKVRNRAEAARLGDIVGETISIIYAEYRSPAISYGDKAANIYKRVRIDPEDAISLMERYEETVEFVANLSPAERAKYLN
jgi:hypothetical protein